MGFMDKFKDATNKAGESAKMMGEAAAEGSDPRNIAGAQDMNRLGREGVETTATLKSMTATSDKKLGGGTEYQLEVDVQPPGGGDPYPATITQQLIEQSVMEYEKLIPGPIKVKVDPNDPQKMLLWG